jgi:hypothetical protein
MAHKWDGVNYYGIGCHFALPRKPVEPLDEYFIAVCANGHKWKTKSRTQKCPECRAIRVAKEYLRKL